MRSCRREPLAGSPPTSRSRRPLYATSACAIPATRTFLQRRVRHDAIVLTKDSDFVRILEQQGSPPKVLWLRCGNTSEAALQQILAQHLSTALTLLDGGEDLVEIGSP